LPRSRVDHVSRIAGELERAILAGEFSPGDRLPSEREISARSRVSRSVVREAIGRLSGLGLVRSVRGSGTRVEAPDGRLVTVGYRQLIDRADVPLENLAEVRLPLETAIAALAARTRDDEHLARLDAAQTVLGDDGRSLEEQVEADLEFHATLAEATGNQLFQLILAPIRRLLIESRRRTIAGRGSDVAHRQHQIILDAVRAQDSPRAAESMRDHIESSLRHLRELGSGEKGKR
jgi:GntR family transcriptional regulator, transcriptional repressor for pyruvate dehydrogenase complex